MAKTKQLQIWRGNGNKVITFGEPLERYETPDGYCYRGYVSHRGFIPKKEFVNNIPEYAIGKKEDIIDKGKKRDNWEVIEIHFDYTTGTLHLPDVNPSIINQLNSWQFQAQMWKAKFHDMKRRAYGGNVRERMMDEMMDIGKNIGKIKGYISPSYDGYSGLGFGYSNRTPFVTGSSFMNSGEDNNENQ